VIKQLLVVLTSMLPLSAGSGPGEPFWGFSFGAKLPAGSWSRRVDSGAQIGLVGGYQLDSVWSFESGLDFSRNSVANKASSDKYINAYDLSFSVRGNLVEWERGSLYLSGGVGASHVYADQNVTMLTPGPGDSVTAVETTSDSGYSVTRPSYQVSVGINLIQSKNTLRFELRYIRTPLSGVCASTLNPMLVIVW
jgi:hypothetical protein